MTEHKDNIIYLNNTTQHKAMALREWTSSAQAVLSGKRITSLYRVVSEGHYDSTVLALDSGDTFFVARGAVEAGRDIQPGYIFNTAVWKAMDQSKWNADAFEELTDDLPSHELEGRTIIDAKYLNEQEVDDVDALFVNGTEGPYSVLIISLDDGTHWSISANKRFSFPGALLPILNAKQPDKPSDLPALPAVTLSGLALTLV